MLQYKSRRSAFTLIELLVVVIIVAVLASVGIPLLSANIIQARASEGVAGLGTIRTALRAMFAETADFTLAPDGTAISTGAVIGSGVPGIAVNDLDGRFFFGNAYQIESISTAAYCISAGNSGANSAVAAGQVAGVTRFMNEVGTLSDTACPPTGT